jgi:hypothetical protein
VSTPAPDPRFAHIQGDELRAAMASVTDFLEQRGSMPGLHHDLIAGANSDPSGQMAHLTVGDLSLLLVALGGPHPVWVQVEHKGPFTYRYITPAGAWWVEGRPASIHQSPVPGGARMQAATPAEYGIWELRADRGAIDKTKPDAFAPDQGAAKRHVREISAARLAQQYADRQVEQIQDSLVALGAAKRAAELAATADYVAGFEAEHGPISEQDTAQAAQVLDDIGSGDRQG